MEDNDKRRNTGTSGRRKNVKSKTMSISYYMTQKFLKSHVVTEAKIIPSDILTLNNDI